MKKRVVSVFLALVMCLSLLPTAALADETAYVAEVTVNGETTKYADFSKAADAATERNANNSTLKLLADTEVPKSISLSASTRTWTFDLNGKTLTQTSGSADYFLQFYSGNVTIQDGVGGGKVIGLNRAIRAENNSGLTLNITGGTFVGQQSNGLIVGGNANVHLSGGTFYTLNENEPHSIWYETHNVKNLLLSVDYRYQTDSGAESSFGGSYASTGWYQGVVGKTTVALAPSPGSEISYIGADGTQAACQTFTQVTGTTATLTAGWYAVTSDTSISSLTANGEVNLILCDGATLTVSGALAVSGTLNLYFQQNGTGKLTAGSTTGSGTVTAPAGDLRKTTDTAGVTYEKCLSHTWNYTQNTDGETHTATCSLCRKTGETSAHTYNWASNGETGHTGTCVDCGAKKAEDHTLSYVITDATHKQKCGVCGYETAEAAHNFGDNSICTDCGANQTATEVHVRVTLTLADGTTQSKEYTDLLEAFKAAGLGKFTADSGQEVSSDTVDVQLLDANKSYTLVSDKMFPISFEYRGNVTIDLNGCTLRRTVTEDTHGILRVNNSQANVTLTNGTLALTNDAYNPAEAIRLGGEGGTLTLENMTVTAVVSETASARSAYAISVESGGTLNIKSGTYGKVDINNYNSAVAQLSGGSYDSVACNKDNAYAELLAKGYIFAKQSDDSYIDPSTMKNELDNENIKNIKVIPCDHNCAFVDGACERCGLTCTKHAYASGGKCETCGRTIVASDGTNYYVSLNEAFANVSDPGEIWVQADLPAEALTFNVDKTATLELYNRPVPGNEDTAATLTVESGNLTVINGAAGSTVVDNPAVITNNGDGFAVCVTGGTLAFGGKVTLTGGLQVIGGGKLEGGLKEGSILIAGTGNAMEGESGSSVSVRDSVNNQSYGVVLDLLGEGLAFAKYDESAENKAGAIVDGSVKQLTEDVIVVAHKHSVGEDNKCACGYTCPHNDFKDGKCTICGNRCAHTDVGDDGVCRNCQTQMAVKITASDSTVTYSTDFKSAMRNATNGTKITLLADVSIVNRTGISGDGTTVTLDLNGHKITSGWLDVGGKDTNETYTTCTLKIIGKGSYEPPMYGGIITVDVKATLDLSEWEGGTISSINISDNSNYEAATREAAVIVGPKAGTIGKLTFGNNQLGELEKTKLSGGSFNEIWAANHQPVKLGDLLVSGYALQYEDGSYEQYTKTLQNESIYNVKVVKCPHAKINEDGHCAYCNATDFVAQVTAADGSSSAYTDIAAAIAAADGGTVKLLANAGEITIGSPLKLDLNGKTAAKLTVTGDVTLASLLPEGCAFKSGSTWITDLTGTELTNVSMAKLPIKSMDYETKMSMTYGGMGTLLVKVTKEPGTGAVTFQWYKVEGGKETAVGSATTKNQFDLSALKLPAGQHTFRFSATCDGYKKMSQDIAVTVQRASISASRITPPTAQENLTYTGQEQALITAGSVTSGGTMQYSLTENGTYSQNIPVGTDAGTYTVWYRVIGDANHNDTAPASVAVRIGQKPLTITGVTAASKPYDGTTDAGITSVTFDGVTLDRGTDYTVTASFDDADVGSGKNVTATVTLTGQAAKNYALEQSSFPTTGSIIRAAAPDFTKETALTIVNGYKKTYTVTLPTLPTLEKPKEYGAPTYELGEIKLNDGYYTGGAKVENGELTLPIQKNDVETTGSVGTVTVVIKSANYEDITLTVNVSAKNKIKPTPVGTITATPITYGDALSKSKISGKMKDLDTGKEVEGTFA